MKYLIAAALASCASGALSAPMEVKLCTGSESGVYYPAGKIIADMAKGSKEIAVTVLETGGTWDNMGLMLGGDCQAMIGQPDGPAYLARTKPADAKRIRQISDLHREYLHVLCSKESGVDDLADLSGDPTSYSLAVGDTGSGSWLLYENIGTEDESYQLIPATTESGLIALSAVASDAVTCMLYPAGLGSGFIAEADANFGDSVTLAEATDKDFNDAKDIRGKPLYEWATIPSKTYPNHFQSGMFSGVDTISWLAGVYVDAEAFNANPKALSDFIRAVSRARPAIRSQYGE